MTQVREATAAFAADAPLPVRFGLAAATVLGIVGGVVGLVLGLVSYPPTAWFAVLEIGVPAALLGFLAGLATGALVHLRRRT